MLIVCACRRGVSSEAVGMCSPFSGEGLIEKQAVFTLTRTSQGCRCDFTRYRTNSTHNITIKTLINMTAQPKTTMTAKIANKNKNCMQPKCGKLQAANSKQQATTNTCNDLVASDTMPKRAAVVYFGLHVYQPMRHHAIMTAIVYFSLHVTHGRRVHGCLSC